MNSRMSCSWSCLLSGLLVLSAVNANESESGLGIVHIDGAVEPEKIPDRVRYGMFVKRYSLDIRDHLIQKLSHQDDAILNSVVAQDEVAEQSEDAQYQADMLTLCLNRGNKTPVAVARDLEQVVDAFYDRRVNRYLRGFASLSPPGRQVVESYIANTIVPHSMATVFDSVAWAKNDPTDFLESLAISCYVAETGELPEELKQRLD